MNTLKALLILSAVIISIASANGVAEEQNKDRTGSPDGSNTCGQCHTGGFYNPQMLITVENLSGTEVQSYVPGETYSITFNVSSFIPFPDVYGFQATALLTDLNDAGTFMDPGVNVQIEEVNTMAIPSRHVVEHTAPSFISSFEVDWVAPVSGSGDVTFYASGIAANGNNEPEGDNASSAALTMTEADPDGMAEDTFSNITLASENGTLMLNGPDGIIIDEIQVFDLQGKTIFTSGPIQIPVLIRPRHIESGIVLIKTDVQGQVRVFKNLYTK